MRWSELPAVTPALATVEAWLQTHAATLDTASFAALAAQLHAGDGAPREPLVAIESAAVDSAWAHLAPSPLERGGLLLGRPLYGETGAGAEPRLVHVRAAIPGLDDSGTEYSLRLNPAVWDSARTALEPGEVVVGWFHSHPDLGAFFSGTDRRTQAGFFAHDFSLGWVVDPVRGEQAWFRGAHSMAVAPTQVLRLART